EVALDAVHPDDFSRMLDARWRQRLSTRQMYVNDLFLTLVRRPLQGGVGLFEGLRNFVPRSGVERTAVVASEKRALD
ncbi:hypothetical protein, partial [Salmonella enterica]|uniref:hypothetical protein n=1 Tax=Salmonella enterica TaxID=28901 RepID=UPI003D2991B4